MNRIDSNTGYANRDTGEERDARRGAGATGNRSEESAQK